MDNGRLGTGYHSSGSSDSPAISLSSSSVSSSSSSPSEAPRGELVRSTVFVRVLPRPERGDAAWARTAVRFLTWSSSEESYSCCYAGGSLGTKTFVKNCLFFLPLNPILWHRSHLICAVSVPLCRVPFLANQTGGACRSWRPSSSHLTLPKSRNDGVSFAA